MIVFKMFFLNVRTLFGVSIILIISKILVAFCLKEAVGLCKTGVILPGIVPRGNVSALWKCQQLYSMPVRTTLARAPLLQRSRHTSVHHNKSETEFRGTKILGTVEI
jgi:hypothetical protein